MYVCIYIYIYVCIYIYIYIYIYRYDLACVLALSGAGLPGWAAWPGSVAIV